MIRHEHVLRNPSFTNRTTGRRMPNDNGWQDRHIAAILAPSAFEAAIVGMLAGWARYADAWRSRESPIGNDYVLGPEWEAIGRGIHGLLNGETGRLDCGTLSAFIYDTLETEGFKRDA